jgi:hypothetical protein
VLIKNYIENNRFLKKEEVEEYCSFVSSENFAWFLNTETNPGYEFLNDDAFLVHHAYSDGFPNSPHCYFFIDIFNKFCKKESINYKSILRIRLNLLFSRSKNFITGPHVDFLFPHNVFLYYFNDSDGDTVFYKEKFTNSVSPKSLEEDLRVSPVAGKGMVFEGSRFHSPSSPKKYRTRITLNIDFL